MIPKILPILTVLVVAFPASSQCRVDDAGGGLGNAASPLAIAELNGGSGPQVWISGYLGTNADFGVRRLAGAAWQAVGAPFRYATTMTVFDSGAGPQIHAAAILASSGGVQRWNGTAWAPVGQLSAASVLQVANLGAGNVLLAGNEGVDQWNGTSWSRLYTMPFINTPVGPRPGAAWTMAAFDPGTGAELWVGGAFGPTTDINLVRRSTTGVWSSAGIAADQYVKALHVHDDGTSRTLIVGGAFSRIGGVQAARIARWNGSAWSPIAGPVGPTVESLATYDEGAGPRLFAGLGDGSVLRLDGTGWTVVGRASGPVLVLRPLPARGTLAAGGQFTAVSGVPALAAAEWNGTAWAPLGSGLISDYPGMVHALRAAATPTGSALFAGGEFQAAGNGSAMNIARFDGSTWSRLGGGLRSVSASVSHRVAALAWHTDTSGPALFAGGWRLEVADDALPIANIARWDGQRWTSPGGGLPGAYVIGLESHGGSLFVASSTTTAYGAVARWDGSAWQRADAGLGAVIPWDLRVVDWGAGPQLLAGSGSGLFRWTGAGWSPFGPAVGFVWKATVFDDGSGPALYLVSGGFLLKWRGASWQAVGTARGQLARIESLEVVDDGSGPSLWASGSFTSINDLPMANLARWNGRTWSAPSPADLSDALRISGSQLAIGEAIATLDSGIFVGGQFGGAGGTVVNGLARWDCGVAPSVSWTQAGGAGGPLTIANANLVAGRTYFNLLSLEPCAAGPGTGPLLGLCASTPAALQFLASQVTLPLGTPLFHFVVATPYTVWGPFFVPGPLTLDAITLDVTSGLGRVSPVARIVVR